MHILAQGITSLHCPNLAIATLLYNYIFDVSENMQVRRPEGIKYRHVKYFENNIYFDNPTSREFQEFLSH